MQSAQTVTASRQNAWHYDGRVSGPIIYSYVGGNPLGYVDPLGLELVPVTLPGLGNTYLDSSMVGPVNSFVSNASASGTQVTISSAFRTTANQGTLNNSNSITPASAGSSLHEAGYAVDINWSQIPANQRQSIIDSAANAGLSWGGNFKKADPVHFYKNPDGSRADAIQDAQNRYKCLSGGCACQ